MIPVTQVPMHAIFSFFADLMAFSTVLAPVGAGLDTDRSAEVVGSTLLNYHYDDDDVVGGSSDYSAHYIKDKMGFSSDIITDGDSNEFYREEPRFAAAGAVSYDPWKDIFQEGQFSHPQKKEPVASVYQKRPRRRHRPSRNHKVLPEVAENRRLWRDYDYYGGETPTSDKKDHISGIYGESDDYFYVDGADDKIDYGSHPGLPCPDCVGYPGYPQQDAEPTLTERQGLFSSKHYGSTEGKIYIQSLFPKHFPTILTIHNLLC